MKISVITDTAADLPAEIIKKNDIGIVPHTISFKKNSFKLGEDISFIDYYKILDNLKTIPDTASPEPAYFFNIFKEKLEENKTNYVFCVTVSAELSATYSSAKIAARKIGGNVILIDSEAASGLQGLIALNIVKLAEKGVSIEEIQDSVAKMKKESVLTAGFHTLENIYKFGRLKSKSILLLTKFLKVKPILVLEEKKFLKLKFPGFFSEANMLNRIEKTALKKINKNLVFDMVVSHVDNIEGAKKLIDKIKKKIRIKNEYITFATPLVGTHTGWKTIILSLV
ncbi:MAG: DegV family protein, partial [Candidatus Thorarchaeota archaeon]